MLSAAVSVTFRIAGRLPGRKVGRRCLVQTPGNRHGKKCVRSVTSGGAIMRDGQAGADHFLLSRRLAPGTYALTATPAGGVPEHVTFRILG
jgi:hypothetical protein